MIFNLNIVMYILEVEGLCCLELVMMVRKIICMMLDGEVLLVMVDDFFIMCDIFSFCCFMDY